MIKKTFTKVKKGWTSTIAIFGAIATIFASVQAYNYFATPNISGEWYITLNVKSSTYHAYIGDVIGLRVYFTQSDNNVSGHGEKWDYRGKRLNYNQHRKLEFEGSMNKRKFKTSYVLHGELAETTGILEVEIYDNGKKMLGTFTGTAADTRGTVFGEMKE